MNNMVNVDLNKVPPKRLRSIARNKKIDLGESKNLTDVRQKLVAGITQEELRELTSEYIYASNTSVLWYKYTSEEHTEFPINFENITTIRPHMGIDNNTPASIAGLNLELGRNKIQNLIKQSAGLPC